MATSDLSTMANVLASNYGSLIVDSLVDASGNHLQGLGLTLDDNRTITGRLRAKGRIFIGGADSGDSGRYARQWPVLHDVGAAASYGAADAFPSATVASYGLAALDFKRNGIPLEFDNMSRAAARGRSVVGGAEMDALDREYKGKMKALFAAIETQLVGDGTGGVDDITGMKAMLQSGAAYAGINTSNGYWAPALLDITASPTLTLANIQTVLRTMNNSNARPNEIWCSMTQFHKLQTLLGARVQYVTTADQDAFVTSFLIDGIPVYPISSMNATNGSQDEIWFVDTDQMELRFLPLAPSSSDVGNRTEQGDYFGFPIGIEPVASGKDALAFFIKAYSQLVILNPSKFGAILNAAV